MALIKCDECGRDISTRSLFCPGCGHPTHLNSGYPNPGEVPEAYEALEEAAQEADPAVRHRRNERAKVWLFLTVSLVVLATIVFFYYTSTINREADAELDDEWEEWLDEPATSLTDTIATDSIPEPLPEPFPEPLPEPKPQQKPAPAPAPVPPPAPAPVAAAATTAPVVAPAPPDTTSATL